MKPDDSIFLSRFCLSRLSQSYLGLTLQIFNLWLNRRSLHVVSAQFENIESISSDSIQGLVEMSEQSVRDLLQEIRIASATLLQPGKPINF